MGAYFLKKQARSPILEGFGRNIYALLSFSGQQYYKKETIKQRNMAHDLLTRESPEIIRFFQDIGHITELLKSEPDRYRPVLNGDRYITETELSELLKITRRTLVEHRTTGLIPYYRLGGRILYKEKDIIKLLDENRLEAF